MPCPTLSSNKTSEVGRAAKGITKGRYHKTEIDTMASTFVIVGYHFTLLKGT